MKESLEKLIKRVILKKYPWVKDFDVNKIKDDNFSWRDMYGVTYHIDYRLLADEYLKDDEDGNVVFNKLRSETMHLYNILGPSPSDGWCGVTFKIYKGDVNFTL
jgi:hypothetical protein